MGSSDATRQCSRGSWWDRALLRLRLARARGKHEFVREELLTPRVVEAFEPDFPEGEAAYNGVGVRDGRVYAAISTKQLHAGARLYALEENSLRFVADLDAALGVPRAIPQGKVHVDLELVGDRLIGATHIGYYDPHSIEERPGSAPGFAPYPGGRFFAIERDETITQLGVAPAGEGIITMSVNRARDVLHALTWPGGLLLAHDLKSGATTNQGAVFEEGQRICRSIAVEPESGRAFWSDTAGAIHEIGRGRVTSMREQWRKVVWHAGQRVFYGVSWDSGTLFRFDPATLVCEDVAGLNVGDAAATLAFVIDGDRVHYLATGPGILRRDDIQLATTVMYVTHDLALGTTTKSGPLRLADGRWLTQAQARAIVDKKLVSICHVEVPCADVSPRAERIRELRRATKEMRARGYAEEMIVTRFDA